MCLLPQPLFAVYDPLSVPNNRFGIHILEPAEVERAAGFVNSTGGDWGYVTIPIRANDRDLVKWARFMEESRRLHLIPILRIATFPVEDRWTAPNEYDIVDFANFLDELPWPIANRYIVVYNEPNHGNEWGGFVDPAEYARVLDRAMAIFRQKNADFYMISAGLDASASNNSFSMNEYDYMRVMNATVPGIFSRVDGVAAHAYGNPGFSSAPNVYSRHSVGSFKFEENFLSGLGVSRPKIFITEAGWRHDLVGEKNAAWYFRWTFANLWNDENVVAVTPFVLNAPTGPFSGFSFLDENGAFRHFTKELFGGEKIAGRPTLVAAKATVGEREILVAAEQRNSSWRSSILSQFGLFLRNLFRL